MKNPFVGFRKDTAKIAATQALILLLAQVLPSINDHHQNLAAFKSMRKAISRKCQ